MLLFQFLLSSGSSALLPETLYRADGVLVVDTATHRQLIFDRQYTVIQSSVEHDSIRSGLAYIEGFHIAAMAVPEVRKVLFVGGGGCVAPTQFAHFYPGARVDVVEVSAQIASVAQRYFYYDRPIVVEDARDFIARVADNYYDVVLMDAYYGDGIMVEGLDLKRIGNVVMTNSLSGKGEGTRFDVPGKRQKLFMTGGELRLKPYNVSLLPRLREIYESAERMDR